MLEQILNGLFFGFLIYMLIGVVFALLRPQDSTNSFCWLPPRWGRTTAQTISRHR
jgi:hypothetical protein